MNIKQLLTMSAVVAATMMMQSTANALGPAAEVPTGYACTNSGGSLTLRSGPGQKFTKLASVAHGEKLAVLSEQKGSDDMTWYKVRFGKRIGWVRYDYVCGV